MAQLINTNQVSQNDATYAAKFLLQPKAQRTRGICELNDGTIFYISDSNDLGDNYKLQHIDANGLEITSNHYYYNGTPKDLIELPYTSEISVVGQGGYEYRFDVFNSLNGTMKTLSYENSTYPPFNGDVNSIVFFPVSGDVIAAGAFTKFRTSDTYRVAKFDHTTGELKDFNLRLLNYEVEAMKISPDNSFLIIGGDFTSMSSKVTTISTINACRRICKVSPLTGSFDDTFMTNMRDGFNNKVWSLEILPDNRILVGGTFTTYGGSYTTSTSDTGVNANRIIMLKPDGTVDNTFVYGNGCNDVVYSIAVDTTRERIYLGGNFSTYNNVSKNKLVAIKYDGSIDTSFNIGTGFNSDVDKIIVQSNGKVICGGKFTTFNGVTTGHIVRLLPDGSSDNTSISSEAMVEKTINNTDVSNGSGSTGNLVIEVPDTGILYPNDNRIATYEWVNSNFSDFTYGNPTPEPLRGLTKHNLIENYSVDESYLNNLTNDQAVKRSLIAGITKSYNIKGTDINDIGVYDDGKIIIVGKFKNANGVPVNGIVRFNSLGHIDTTFISSGYSPNTDEVINCIKILSDGKILIGGAFNTFNGVAVKSFCRLNSNGTIDSTFPTNMFMASDGNEQAIIYDCEVVGTTDYVICGKIYYYGTIACSGLVKVNSTNGAINTSFVRINPTNECICSSVCTDSSNYIYAVFRFLPYSVSFSSGTTSNTVNKALAWNGNGALVNNFTNTFYNQTYNLETTFRFYSAYVINGTTRKCMIISGLKYNANGNDLTAVIYCLTMTAGYPTTINLTSFSTTQTNLNDTLTNYDTTHLTRGNGIFYDATNSKVYVAITWGLSLDITYGEFVSVIPYNLNFNTNTYSLTNDLTLDETIGVYDDRYSYSAHAVALSGSTLFYGGLGRFSNQNLLKRFNLSSGTNTQTPGTTTNQINLSALLQPGNDNGFYSPETSYGTFLTAYYNIVEPTVISGLAQSNSYTLTTTMSGTITITQNNFNSTVSFIGHDEYAYDYYQDVNYNELTVFVNGLVKATLGSGGSVTLTVSANDQIRFGVWVMSPLSTITSGMYGITCHSGSLLIT